MFTGIVTDVGEVLSVEARGALKRLRLACSFDVAGVDLGALSVKDLEVGRIGTQGLGAGQKEVTGKPVLHRNHVT